MFCQKLGKMPKLKSDVTLNIALLVLTLFAFGAALGFFLYRQVSKIVSMTLFNTTFNSANEDVQVSRRCNELIQNGLKKFKEPRDLNYVSFPR